MNRQIIYDQATRDLMVNFYTNLSKMSKDEALRQAQLKVKKQYKHPYYWAALPAARYENHRYEPKSRLWKPISQEAAEC
jgi:hypothetical protein